MYVEPRRSWHGAERSGAAHAYTPLIRVPDIRPGNGLPRVSKEAFAVIAGVTVRLDVEG